MNPAEFINNYLSELLQLYTNFLLPYISTPSRVTPHSRTLVDKNFSEAQFKSELFNINWKSVLEINKKGVDFSFSKLLETFNTLLQKHAPIKKLSKKDKKAMKKPWITKGILKSIEKKNRIYRKCIRTKNATKKEELYNLFKSYRNSLNKITRLSKANHYKIFFEDNKNN